MLVLALFIPVCVISVVFLLRFLFAVNSELKPLLRPSAAGLSCISTYHRAPSGARTRLSTLTLVHSNAGLARRERFDFQERPYGQAEKIQFRKA